MRAIFHGYVIFFLSTLLFSLSFTTFSEARQSYDELYESYTERRAGYEAAAKLKVSLLSMPADGNERDFWEDLWRNDLSSREIASRGLHLMEKLFPDGDVSKWDEISGVWTSSRTSRSLAAVDGVMMTASSLLNMDETGASWLARELLEKFSSSSRGRLLFITTSVENYSEILQKLRTSPAKEISPRLMSERTVGKLPLARPPRGYITSEGAMRRRMSFLNAYGHPARGLGSYAWDRKSGNIYIVVDKETGMFWPFSGHDIFNAQ